MQHTSKAHKFFCLFSLFFGISFFGAVVAVVHGWTPFPSASAKSQYDTVAVIPQDKPQNIETDAVLAAPKPIQVAEVIIVGERIKARPPQPGAARRMPTANTAQNVSESQRPLVGPTGLASEAALNYRPSLSHPVRGPSLGMRVEGFSAPSRGTQRPERETWVFEANE